MNAILVHPKRNQRRTESSSTTASAHPSTIACTSGEPFVDPVQRREMIAEAAYYHSERRAFEPGHELDDWLAAENQIDAALTLERCHVAYGD